jgi:hypothetical protein
MSSTGFTVSGRPERLVRHGRRGLSQDPAAGLCAAAAGVMRRAWAVRGLYRERMGATGRPSCLGVTGRTMPGGGWGRRFRRARGEGFTGGAGRSTVRDGSPWRAGSRPDGSETASRLRQASPHTRPRSRRCRAARRPTRLSLRMTQAKACGYMRERRTLRLGPMWIVVWRGRGRSCRERRRGEQFRRDPSGHHRVTRERNRRARRRRALRARVNDRVACRYCSAAPTGSRSAALADRA